MRIVSAIAASVIASGLVGCRDSVAPASDVLRTATTPLPPALRLQNETGEPVYYFVAERNALALLDFVLCTTPSCPAVPARGAVSLPYGEIAGYRSGAREAVVLHWRLRPQSGGYAPDSVRALVVPL